MLHNLALAANDNNPSLLKEAIISPAEDRLIQERLERKAVEMANARGINVPLVSKPQFDPGTGKVISGLTPDIENLRMNPRAKATTGIAQGLTPNSLANPEVVKGLAELEPSPGANKAFKQQHTIPGRSVSPGGQSALIEKEIQKAHGTVSNSPLKKLRHNTVGKAKRVWGGKGLLGGKWRNRAGIIGGAAALGLGIKAYLDANKTPQPTLAPPEPEQSQYPAYEGYPKMGASKYSPDAVTIPTPTAQPKVAPLGPGVGSTPKITASGGGKTTSSGFLGGSSGSGSSSGGGDSKVAADEGILPLLGVGAGGLGGWALGEKVISPLLENKEKQIAEEIARKQQILGNYRKVRKAAPMGAAAAGALLLAALTAMYVKKKSQPTGPLRPIQVNPYDQTGAGFAPQEQNQWGNYYG